MSSLSSISKLASWCKIASPHNVVYNNECVYTFYGPYHTGGSSLENKGGLLVNCNNFIGTCESLAHRTLSSEEQEGLFVRIIKSRTLKENVEEDETKKDQPTKLGIGVEGGFASAEEKYNVTSTYSIVILQKNGNIVEEQLYADCTKDTFPTMVAMSVDSIVNHAGSAVQQDLSAWQLDDEPLKESKYAATLPFVDNGVTISPNPSDWKCQASGRTDHVWLNLSTGYMGGGRRHWDGSGGSNGALDHYNETGQKYPLVVKLGTITSDPTTADCYSYAPDEDGPVKISNLNELLAKRGIKVTSLQKTVKSTAELEVELNATYAFDAITESGSTLTPVSGPGLQGLQNLGNSCYINTVVQTLFSGTVPELAKRYGTTTTPINDDDINVVISPPLFQTTKGTDAPNDVLVQTTKLAMALTSGAYANPEIAQDINDPNADKDLLDPKYRLAPRMYKHAISKNHSEFSTGQQQDAAHFFQHLLERLDQNELKTKTEVLSSHLFQYKCMSRIVCTADSLVKYKSSAPETILSLRIPMELATNTNEEDAARMKDDTPGSTTTTVTTPQPPEAKRAKSNDEDNNNGDDSFVVVTAEDAKEDDEVPTIPLGVCLESWHAPVTMDDYKWPHLGNNVIAATSQSGLMNFPRYLMVQLNRYELGADWVPKKLDVKVQVPLELNLNHLKCTGEQQEGESLVPDVDDDDNEDATMEVATNHHVIDRTPAETAVQKPVPIDEMALSQLMDMGFSMYGCQRALKATGGNNVEAAMNWIFEHNTDPDFNDPLPTDDNDDDSASNAAVATTASSIATGIGGGGGAAAAAASDNVDETAVSNLVESLGCFTRDQVKAALKATSGSMDRAADWLFSHMDDLDSAIAALEVSSTTKSGGGGNADSAGAGVTVPSIPLDDSSDGTYVLRGCISHIGKHTGNGHYVCHLLKQIDDQEQWVIFNDEKVALSEHPPLEHAYLYLFQRKDTLTKPDERF